jgi:hypothetical protein
MYTSKEYIRMCKKAEEIQKDWIANYGDSIYIKILKTTSHIQDSIGCAICFGNEKLRDKVIWLPFQCQLQDMIDWQNLGPAKVTEMGYRLFKFLEIPHSFTSMEQLWLGFVMWEKYKKVWEAWKKEGKITTIGREDWVEDKS